MSQASPGSAGAPLLIKPRMRVKLAALSIEAYTLVTKVWLYHQDSGHAGRFHVDELPAAVDRLLTPAKIRKAVAEAERPVIEHRDGSTSPLWLSIVDDHVVMPAWFLEDNPPPEVWTDETLRWRRARNKELHSPKCNDLREKIKKRDRHLCRYCGVRVRWESRNADDSATYDHVDPDEGNTLSNVVVACRRCNGRKKDRTPDQWIADEPSAGLSLLPAGTLAVDADGARQTARAGPDSGSTRVRPESNVSSRPRARPSRVEPGSNPSRPAAGPGSSRPVPASPPGRVEPPLVLPPDRVSASACVPSEFLPDEIPHPADREDCYR